MGSPPVTPTPRVPIARMSSRTRRSRGCRARGRPRAGARPRDPAGRRPGSAGCSGTSRGASRARARPAAAGRGAPCAVPTQRAASEARPRQSPRARRWRIDVAVLGRQAILIGPRAGPAAPRTAGPRRPSGTRRTRRRAAAGPDDVRAAQRAHPLPVPEVLEPVGAGVAHGELAVVIDAADRRAAVLEHDEAAAPRLATPRAPLAADQQRDRLHAVHGALELAADRGDGAFGLRRDDHRHVHGGAWTPRRRGPRRGGGRASLVRASGIPRTASWVSASPSTETVTRSTRAASRSATRRSSSSVPLVVTSVRMPRSAASEASAANRGCRSGSPHWKSNANSRGPAPSSALRNNASSITPRGRAMRPSAVGQNVHLRLQRFVSSRFAESNAGARDHPNRYASSFSTPPSTARGVR